MTYFDVLLAWYEKELSPLECNEYLLAKDSEWRQETKYHLVSTEEWIQLQAMMEGFGL